MDTPYFALDSSANLMVTLVSRRYERASLIVTSNTPFSASGVIVGHSSQRRPPGEAGGRRWTSSPPVFQPCVTGVGVACGRTRSSSSWPARRSSSANAICMAPVTSAKRRDQRQQRHGSGAGVREHDHAERDREHAAQPEQQRPSAAEREVEREGDLEDAEGDRPRGDGVEQPQRREVGPDEDGDADRDSEQAFEDEPGSPPARNGTLNAPAIVVTPGDEREGAEERDQRGQADVRPDEDDDGEGDRKRAAQRRGLPDVGELLLALLQLCFGDSCLCSFS